MEFVNFFKKYKPLALFSFPSGWVSLKNNMYDIDPAIFDSGSSHELSCLEDLFFGEDVFMARCEMPLTNAVNIMAVLSIGCRLMKDDLSGLPSHCFYDVEVTLYSIKSKRKNSFFEKKEILSNRYDAAKKTSEYMMLFSNYIYPDLQDGILDLNGDLDTYFS
ncbi:hypothetical protein JHU04_001243 [Brenneria sp. 4F2]|nr:hypothetical protein [Brenneria bubanii]